MGNWCERNSREEGREKEETQGMEEGVVSVKEQHVQRQEG